nr:MAG TPA: hypothetical protein [Bacteriophage sp.]
MLLYTDSLIKALPQSICHINITRERLEYRSRFPFNE